MNPAISSLLRRQAEWQRKRKNLPWSEKIRQAVILRATSAKMKEEQQKIGGSK